MALFKVYRGNESNLPTAMNDGYAYFCTDTGNFYIDWDNGTGILSRAQINARSAVNLRYLSDEEYVELSAAEISLAVTMAHEHANKDVIDSITADVVAKWNKKTIYFEPTEPEGLDQNSLWVEIISDIGGV